MSDWRPYEPSLEAERSAVYERAKGRVAQYGVQRGRRSVLRTREEEGELFSAGLLPCELL